MFNNTMVPAVCLSQRPSGFDSTSYFRHLLPGFERFFLSLTRKVYCIRSMQSLAVGNRCPYSRYSLLLLGIGDPVPPSQSLSFFLDFTDL